MNRADLVEALEAVGVRPPAYFVRGMPGAGLHEGGVILDYDAAGRWFCGTRERGVVTVLGSFDTEEATCAYAFDLLRPVRPADEDLSPEVRRAIDEARQAQAEQLRRNLAKE